MISKKCSVCKGCIHRAADVKSRFFIGGSGGSGALLARDTKTNNWSYPVFYTMGSVSFGVQIGGEASEIVLMVLSNKGMV